MRAGMRSDRVTGPIAPTESASCIRTFTVASASSDRNALPRKNHFEQLASRASIPTSAEQFVAVLIAQPELSNKRDAYNPELRERFRACIIFGDNKPVRGPLALGHVLLNTGVAA